MKGKEHNGEKKVLNKVSCVQIADQLLQDVVPRKGRVWSSLDENNLKFKMILNVMKSY